MTLENDENLKINNAQINEIYFNMLLGIRPAKGALLYFQDLRSRLLSPEESFKKLREELETFPNLWQNPTWMECYKEANKNYSDARLLDTYIEIAKDMIAGENAIGTPGQRYQENPGSQHQKMKEQIPAIILEIKEKGWLIESDNGKYDIVDEYKKDFFELCADAGFFEDKSLNIIIIDHWINHGLSNKGKASSLYKAIHNAISKVKERERQDKEWFDTQDHIIGKAEKVGGIIKEYK